MAMRYSRGWLLMVGLVSACKCGKTEAPPPADKSAPPASATGAPAAASPSFKRSELGGALNVDPTKAATVPSIAIAAELTPAVAWVESGAIHVRQWGPAAGEWRVIGGAPLTTRAAHGPRVALAREIIVVFAEMNQDDKVELHAARGSGEGPWTRLGGALNTPITGNASQPSLALTPTGPVVAWFETTFAGDVNAVRAKRFEGGDWKYLGAVNLTPDPSEQIRGTIELAGLPNGVLAMMWKAKKDPWKLHALSFDPGKNTWSPIPVPEGLDGDSTLSLSSGDGRFYASLSWNAGLKPISTYTPGAASWTSIGLPKPELEAKLGYIGEHRMAGSAIVMNVGGNLMVAHAQDARWSILEEKLNSKPGVGAPAIAGPPGGPLAIAWTDASEGAAKLRVTVFVR